VRPRCPGHAPAPPAGRALEQVMARDEDLAVDVDPYDDGSFPRHPKGSRPADSFAAQAQATRIERGWRRPRPGRDICPDCWREGRR